MRGFKLLDICLSLFGGEGDSGGTQGNAPADAGQDSGGTNERVLYGKQPGDKPSDAGKDGAGKAPAAVQEGTGKAPEATLEDKEKAYRAMIEGEFKEQYIKDTQHLINRRFREEKDAQDGLRAQLDGMRPLLDTLAQRYGVDGGDVGRLLEAVQRDDAWMREAAEESGLSLEQYKEIQRIKAQNSRLLAEQQARVGQERAQRQLMRWDAEAEEARQVYPDIDLNVEARNPQFVALLQSGLPVRAAYEAIHHAELLEAATQAASRDAEAKVVSTVRARGTRPAENGSSSQSGFVVKNDVSKLSNQDLEEINRRVMRGERISFG